MAWLRLPWKTAIFVELGGQQTEAKITYSSLYLSLERESIFTFPSDTLNCLLTKRNSYLPRDEENPRVDSRDGAKMG